MADTHLQVNHDGSISDEKTNLLPNNREIRQRMLTKLFSINNWIVRSIDNPNACLWKIIVVNSEKELKLNIFFSSVRDEARRPDEFKSQFGGKVDPNIPEEGWINIPLGVYVKEETDDVDKWILVAFEKSGINFATNPSLRGVRTKLLQTAQMTGLVKTPFSILFRPEFIYYVIELISQVDNDSSTIDELNVDIDNSVLSNSQLSYLRAMRTKPFLLLAGISGTGKSRIVKQMAFDSCPDESELRKDPTSPGNYCLIEVKPNWHDSTELLGYESKIGGAHYQLTPFVKFLAKAMLYDNTPFFVCLDEMNLAPVEQYFAEFLSVLESRTKLADGHVVSEPLIKSSVFSNSVYENDLKHEIFDVRIKEKDANGIKVYEAELSEKEKYVYELLKENGLRIPENVIVVGTVNMDETTHQFSRKVIDRAMTIEMNLPEGNPFMDFFANVTELAYRANPTSPSLYLATETKASDVVGVLAADNAEKTEWLKGDAAAFLTKLNEALDGTPFKVAYRVQNELMLYFYQLWLEDKEADWGEILRTACDQILMMKVLPRVEGDEELLEKPLEKLAAFCEPYRNALKKINEMTDRLARSRFTSFWP